LAAIRGADQTPGGRPTRTGLVRDQDARRSLGTGARGELLLASLPDSARLLVAVYRAARPTASVALLMISSLSVT